MCFHCAVFHVKKIRIQWYRHPTFYLHIEDKDKNKNRIENPYALALYLAASLIYNFQH